MNNKNASNKKSKNIYSENTIEVLEGLEAVRVRPGMYIGDLNTAVKQMIFEVVDNSIDEFRMGFGKHIDVNINKDTITISDTGRGIPVGIHEQKGISTLELVMTTLHAGGKFNQDNYQYSSGLHGVGVAAANALSKWMEVTVYRDNQQHHIRFEKGKTVQPIKIIGETDKTGTTVTFAPDYTIVEKNLPSEEELLTRLKEMVCLNSGLIIGLNYLGTNHTLSLSKPIDLLNTKDKVTDIFAYKSINAQLIFFWSKNSNLNYQTFTNGVKQDNGGSHLIGLISSILSVIKKFWEEFTIQSGNKQLEDPKAEDIRHGLNCLVSISMNDPQFSSQTKERLTSKEGRIYVNNLIQEQFFADLEENPSLRQTILERVKWAIQSRKSIKKEQESMTLKAATYLPTKLLDCTSKNPKECEIFFVEGDSAGGTAKAGRDIKTQSIMALRGKLLNVSRAAHDKLRKCQEIQSILAAIGLLNQDDISKLRYHKIILMVDADSDGGHIAVLLITVFAVFTPQLLLDGYVYLAQPPLYKIKKTKGNKASYFSTEEQFNQYLVTRALDKHEIKLNEQDIKPAELVEILAQARSIMHYINLNNYGINRKLMSYLIFLESDNLIDVLNREYNFDCTKVNKSFDEQKLIWKISTKYYFGDVHYNIKVNNRFKFIPISINHKLIQDPQSLLDIIEQSYDLQHFKGLGEMNAEELKTTCLDPNTRQIIRLKCPNQETIDQIIHLMGSSDERREIVLDQIKKLFHIDDFKILEYENL